MNIFPKQNSYYMTLDFSKPLYFWSFNFLLGMFISTSVKNSVKHHSIYYWCCFLFWFKPIHSTDSHNLAFHQNNILVYIILLCLLSSDNNIWNLILLHNVVKNTRVKIKIIFLTFFHEHDVQNSFIQLRNGLV